MPGFVDVSNMTAREVRMMDHAADADETDQPRRQWKSRARPAGVTHSVDNVWGAAVAAQRINGSYVKETMYKVDPEMSSNTVVDKRRNRDIMLDILANPALLTVEEGHNIAVAARLAVMQRHRVLNLMTHVDPAHRHDGDHEIASPP